MPRNPEAHGLHPPDDAVSAWAGQVAARFEVDDPRRALAAVGVGLRVTSELFRARGREVWGAWDPQLRRIELFGCGARRSDEQLVAALGHELWHMTNDVRRRVVRGAPGGARDEDTARRFAAAWVARLGPTRVERCATALRALVEDPPKGQPGKRGVLGVGE